MATFSWRCLISPRGVLCDATEVRFLAGLDVSFVHNLFLESCPHRRALVLDRETIGDTSSEELE